MRPNAARDMTPWTALLESLHSALIDELNERKPPIHPELGLPLRQRSWMMPQEFANTLNTDSTDLILFCEMEWPKKTTATSTSPHAPPAMPQNEDEKKMAQDIARQLEGGGAIFLAGDSIALSVLGFSLEELWDRIFKRAGAHFHRRGIQPRVNRRIAFRSQNNQLPGAATKATRVVWIPFRIRLPGESLPAKENGAIFLGMAI